MQQNETSECDLKHLSRLACDTGLSKILLTPLPEAEMSLADNWRAFASGRRYDQRRKKRNDSVLASARKALGLLGLRLGVCQLLSKHLEPAKLSMLVTVSQDSTCFNLDNEDGTVLH